MMARTLAGRRLLGGENRAGETSIDKIGLLLGWEMQSQLIEYGRMALPHKLDYIVWHLYGRDLNWRMMGGFESN